MLGRAYWRVAMRQWGGEDVPVKRALPGSVIGVLLVVGLLLPAGAGWAATPPSTPLPEGTESPIVTIEGDQDLGECISALPKPSCRTSTETDGMQIAVFSILIAGLVVVGWRVVSATRRRDRDTTTNRS
ncbi:MAG: hypothetical protein AB7J47_09295 [Acidimicrobiia bacterium]